MENSKSEINVPPGYNRVMPYLIVKNATGFLEFTKAVFGATEKMKEMRDEKLIKHAEINIGESIIMFADETEQFRRQACSFFIYVTDCDDAYRKALELGATTITEPAQQSYGMSAGITDSFGNTWWLTS